MEERNLTLSDEKKNLETEKQNLQDQHLQLQTKQQNSEKQISQLQKDTKILNIYFFHIFFHLKNKLNNGLEKRLGNYYTKQQEMVFKSHTFFRNVITKEQLLQLSHPKKNIFFW